MKKVGITPGPVKFENMEPNDVKQFTPSNTGIFESHYNKINLSFQDKISLFT